MADQDVSVTVSGNASGAVAAVSSVKQGLQDLHEQGKAHVEALTSTFSKLQETMLAIAAIAAGGAMFKEMVSSTLETTAAVTGLQKSFGMALAEANQTKSSLDLLGLSTDSYTEMATRLIRQLKAGSDSLKTLGLTAKDIDLGQKGLMDKAIGKLAEYKEGVDRNIAAQVMFGRGGADAVKLVRLGLEGVTEKAKEMEEQFGLTVTPQDQANARQYKTVINELGMAFEGIKKAIGDAVLPYLTAFANWFVQIAPGLISNMKSTMASVIDAAFSAAEGFVNFVTNVATGVYNLFVLWQYVKTKMGQSTEGEANAAIDGFERAVNKIEEFRTKALETIASVRTAVTSGKPFDTSALDLGTPNKGTKSASALLDESANKDAISAAMKRAQAEVAIVKAALVQKTSILDMEVALGQITQNQKYAQLEKYTEQAFEQELKILQNQQNIAGQTLVQQQDVLNKIALLKAKHNTEMVNLDKQSIAAQFAQWKTYTDAVAGAFNSQLRGLLTGQTTFAQAAKNVLLDLSLKTIELIVTKPVSEYIAAQLAMLTATQTGAAAKTAAEVAGAESALPAKIASFTSDLTARAALTFAGMMANLSPLMGPAAAGPAAVGEASVMAQMAAVPKFDVGAWSVPRTGLAMVHEREFIAPAGAPADAARAAMMGGGGGGGGGTHHWHIAAWDGASVKGWLQGGGAAQLATAVSGYQNKNRSTRPK